MGFRKVLAALGAGGATVETVLIEENCVPGGVLQGEVRIQGGTVAQRVEGLRVGLRAGVAAGDAREQYRKDVTFGRVRLGGALEVRPGAVHTVPFGCEVPWETPVTTVLGLPLPETRLGLVTELEIARAVDSGDLDPVRVHPLPAQQALLEAFERLGFRFRTAEPVEGLLAGTRQALAFHQEMRFLAPPRYRGLEEVGLAFVADHGEMDVVLDMGREGGRLTDRTDSTHAFAVDLRTYAGTDWAAYLNRWLAEVGGRRNWF